jgi:hypothetical protein
MDSRENLTAGAPIHADPVGLVRNYAGDEPAHQVAFLLDLCLQGDVDASVAAKLTAFLSDGPPAVEEQTARLRQALHTILMLPEYQLA